MSEDVSRFLSQVKELGERRIEEDEARSRELEEKILQDRKERQARRRERARSISPQKSSPANTPPPSQPNDSHRPERLDLVASPILYPPSDPQSQSVPEAEEENMATAATISSSPSKENELPVEPDVKANYPPSPTRSGTLGRGLSWQRRPNSQASERSRSRPLSVVAAENATRSSNSISDQDTVVDNMSRDQIAAALSSKDPSWFRQTADRGANSAAYRRSQVEDTQTVDPFSAQTQLPGMSRSTSAGSFKNGDTPPVVSSALGSTVTSPTNLPDPQKVDLPPDTVPSDIAATADTRGPFSPPHGRTSPTKTDRPISPTKGMGGFVQSAMMKRSESVSKRWNVQSPAGLQRADPTAPNRNSYDPISRTSVNAKVRPTSILRDSSAEQVRSSSTDNKEEDRLASTTGTSLRLDTTSPEPQGQYSGKDSPPVSPSKTMDPRRWSPTKSSWLESALNKPESPKPKPTQPPPNQPAWMAEIQKAKAQKAGNPGAESTKPPVVSHKHQVSIGGLMRSSAPGMTITPVGRGSLHSPSPSISSINTPMINSKPAESQPPPGPGPIKSNSDSTVEIKQVGMPAVSKVKPETPPKKDFRANLRHRAPASSTTPHTGSQQPEFKNVFGSLRKTTTQNYVAPDELKNNISRGKAALTVTNGPQKSERVDEFKDAIIAKKKSFHEAQSEGRGVTRNGSVSSERPIPEGLQKRAELGRSNTIKRDTTSSGKAETESRRPSVVSQRDSVPKSFAGNFERFSTLEKRASVIEGLNSTKPSTTQKPPISKLSSVLANPVSESNSPVRIPGKLGGSTLANRFNPALAGIIGRGPPPTTGSGVSSGSNKLSGSHSIGKGDEVGSGPKLTHMTKSRARGPKRKAPTTSSAPRATAIDSRPIATKRVMTSDTPKEQDTTIYSTQLEETPINEPFKKEVVSPIQPRPKPTTLISASRLVSEPTDIAEANIPRPKPESKILGQLAAFTAQSQQPIRKTSDDPQQTPSQPPSPGKLNMSRMSRFMDATPTSDIGNVPEQSKLQETSLKTRSFLDKSSSQDAEQKPRSPSLNKPKVPLPAPLSLTQKRQSSNTEPSSIAAEPESKIVAPAGPRPLPNPPVASSDFLYSSRPLPTAPNLNSSPQLLPSPGPQSPSLTVLPLRTPSKQSSDSSAMLRDFFGSDRPQRSYRVDPTELLMQRPNLEPPRIKTLSAQLFQLSADGKKQPVPAHHERTLFEREMYLCTHSFNDEAGRKINEVYFWAGDEVPASAAEDAVVFVSREARSFGGTLIHLRQGKETGEFLQALGGIVVTHRGSGNKFDSLAPHVLCGRRYNGHIVFDEVDFTSSALCSGFPYLITQGGRCYLWKGKGSGVDELSCARLIGMDYVLSGELEELEEGREPTEFWDLFDGANRFGSADHWRLKPKYEKYCSRLFLSDAASEQQIIELSIFSQMDLLPTNIYVVDAFFELYIVVGSRAQSQYASFHNALDFAQEYAILASSMEDRPFVPVSTVVLEGIPRDLKSVFRKWQDALSPTVTITNTGLKRGRSLKVVTLSQALQALSE
ncbi:hypothetical protein F5B22DRAFT_585540 [Xylaria bambusicola]|uniref:uncharacterized protein n=1 Tax=Xylaria bambusicola TaxID=326684 RepID=UPI0020079CAD|nr:uncharacterized protein F5B22DRAFT_585540 [Xylaria bambusicola]KAI0526381.1 hypothetical protein F5B22DRAFT_585540 [Xylaria bambusicola]